MCRGLRSVDEIDKMTGRQLSGCFWCERICGLKGARGPASASVFSGGGVCSQASLGPEIASEHRHESDIRMTETGQLGCRQCVIFWRAGKSKSAVIYDAF